MITGRDGSFADMKPLAKSNALTGRALLRCGGACEHDDRNRGRSALRARTRLGRDLVFSAS